MTTLVQWHLKKKIVDTFLSQGFNNIFFQTAETVELLFNDGHVFSERLAEFNQPVFMNTEKLLEGKKKLNSAGACADCEPHLDYRAGAGCHLTQAHLEKAE